MGLGIYVQADLPTSPLGEDRARAQLFERIAQNVLSGLPDHVCRQWLEIQEHAGVLYLQLHPAAEPLEISLPDSGLVAASIKTSTTGPGFHAAVVKLLNHIGSACGLAWKWRGSGDDEGDEAADETGFAVHGDYARLQGAFASFLGSLADVLLEKHDGSSTMWLNWPVGAALRPVVASFSACPTGPIDKGWWQKAASGGAAQQAERFYAWWSRDRSTADWEKTARLMMWSEIRWHPPIDEREQMVMELTIESTRRAGEPESLAGEVDELRGLLDVAAADDEPAPVPRTDGIGFFRGMAECTCPGGWTVTIPGYYYADEEDEGGQLVLWHTGRTVRVSTFTKTEEGGEEDGSDSFEDAFESAPGEVIEMNAAGVLGKCDVAPPGAMAEEDEETSDSGDEGSDEEEGSDDEECWTLQGLAVQGAQLALMTVSFDDGDDQEWSVEVFKTLRPPRAEVELSDEEH